MDTEKPSSADDTPGDLLVLMKIGLARIKQDWHYHLATAAGRPRCGALLNLREWHLQTVVDPPADLCGRCARLINPKARRIHIASSRLGRAEESEAQLGLPLDEDVTDTTQEGARE